MVTVKKGHKISELQICESKLEIAIFGLYKFILADCDESS